MNMQRLLFTAVAITAFGAAGASAEDTSGALKDRTIGYVITHTYWAIHQTPDAKVECPYGFNDGPREQFEILYPDIGEKRMLLDTQLEREREIWFPSTSDEPYPFHEVQGNTAIGLNLDGKTDANDFKSPDGEEGVDNQLYRAIGCIDNYRGPDGTLYHFTNNYMQRHNYNRVLIELTDVDSLVNDDDVTVTTYRGLDSLMTNATGQDFLPGGSQRVDSRWGKEFIQTFKGQIVDGVLTTDPADLTMPATAAAQDATVQKIRDVRFQLRLSPERAEGLMAGYTDVQNFYYQLNAAWSTHLQSYGRLSSPSLYRALRRLADAYPDPTTGENTAISSTLEIKLAQVFIVHPQQKIALESP
jgi:hypothetical protein